MRRNRDAVKADVKRHMNPPQLQSVARIAEELAIDVVSLWN